MNTLLDYMVYRLIKRQIQTRQTTPDIDTIVNRMIPGIVFFGVVLVLMLVYAAYRLLGS